MQQGPTSIGSAVSWIEGALLGSAATVVAIIAVASIGFLMLTGRTDLRHAAQVVLGCFIIFGSPRIAAGIQAAAAEVAGGERVQEAALPERVSAPPPPAYPQVETKPYDPYAGAALTPAQ